MKSKKLKRKWFLLTVFVLSTAFTAATAFYSKELAAIGGLVLLALILIYFAVRKAWLNEYFDSLSDLAYSLEDGENNALMSVPMPVALVYADGEIVWYNKLFARSVANAFEKKSTNVCDYIKSCDFEKLLSSGYGLAEINNSKFSLFVSKASKKDEYLIYFFDITELTVKSEKLNMIKPSVIIGMYDNFDEMFQSLSDSELSELTSSLDKEVSKWFASFNCVFRKIGSERFFAVCHEKDLKRMTEDKFSVLGSVRNFVYNGKPCLATLSIGVGKGEDLKESDFGAKQALDMALSRGGDQVAVRNADSYDFYGGIASGNEKGNRVRSRVVASAIKQLILAADNCIIIGHKFADYDSIGTAIGVYSVMKNFGKDAHIVFDYENSLCKNLVNKYVKETGNAPFVDKKSALQKLNDNTLVFLVDTHRASYCEAPEIINAAKTVAVIDHHRKSVDFFDKAVVFHHNSNASSASEMLTELLPYMSNMPLIGPSEADALLAGIMLDTKNFVLRAGVKTFEAASYLKSRGADSVKVKKLFSTTSEEHKARAEIISSSYIYRECAVSIANLKTKDIRIVTSQAADEMLNISGVKASFVIFKTEDTVNISARSFGEINVQLVMEKLGGGGHLTMAAAQLENCDSRDALVVLKKAIDNYYDSL